MELALVSTISSGLKEWVTWKNLFSPACVSCGEGSVFIYKSGVTVAMFF